MTDFRALHEAIRAEPLNALGWVALSNAQLQHGLIADAESSARQAVSLDESAPLAWRGLANACIAQSKWSEAAIALQRALSIDTNNALYWADLGTVEQHLGHLSAAEAAYERSVSLVPGYPSTLTNFAFLLCNSGRAQRALGMLRPVLTLTPESSPAWIVAGHSHQALGDPINAEAAFRQAVALAPHDLMAAHNLAVALRMAWKLTEAEAQERQVLTADPTFAEAWLSLGVIFQQRGRAPEAIDCFRRALALRPDPAWHSNLLLAMQYASGIDPARLRTAHEAWDQAHALHLHPTQATRAAALRDRRLRIGFVSPHFGRHPTAFLALPALEHLDKTQCHLTCYSDRVSDDEYTLRFRNASDGWRDTRPLSSEELAIQIRADRIDVLVDLAGHTSSRLLVFARKPAPLQVAWLGYPGTTGMTAMDCLLADQFHVRPGEEPFYREKVVRMPNSYACYGPPADAPNVGPLPALANGFTTFGCLSNPAKLNPELLATWSQILLRVPSSRLLLKFHGLNDAALQDEIARQFAAHGIASNRIVLEGESSQREFLDAYNRVDLALDTQPYSGGLTTCEALWMGVPVITFSGKTFAGRHATSYLNSAGFPHFIATDIAGYIEEAVRWASQPAALASLRPHIREQMRHSPLCDAQSFAHDFLIHLQSELEAKTAKVATRYDV